MRARARDGDAHMSFNHSHEPMPEGACAACAATLPLLDDTALDPVQAAAARDHLRGCAACAAARAQYEGLDRGLRRHFGLAAVPPRHTEEIMRFITDRSQPTAPAPAAAVPVTTATSA